MKTVNSISGGKTSSFLDVHYPADYSLFALITVNDTDLKPKDKGLIKIVSDKIGKEFIGTVESDKTLKVVLDLEQYTGCKIIWLTGDPFEEVIKKAGGYLPNIMTRFCTSQMKMKPIAEYCRNEIKETVLMRLGIRADEEQRVNFENTDFKFHNGFSENGRNKWITEKYRELDYPLVRDKIYHYQIYQWSKTIGIDFPSDSNCVGCFHKDVQQLRKNWDEEPEKMQWFASQEIGRKKWKKEMNYNKIKTIGLQSDFNFGTGSGCNAGFCTD